MPCLQEPTSMCHRHTFRFVPGEMKWHDFNILSDVNLTESLCGTCLFGLVPKMPHQTSASSFSALSIGNHLYLQLYICTSLEAHELPTYHQAKCQHETGRKLPRCGNASKMLGKNCGGYPTIYGDNPILNLFRWPSCHYHELKVAMRFLAGWHLKAPRDDITRGWGNLRQCRLTSKLLLAASWSNHLHLYLCWWWSPTHETTRDAVSPVGMRGSRHSLVGWPFYESPVQTLDTSILRRLSPSFRTGQCVQSTMYSEIFVSVDWYSGNARITIQECARWINIQ